MRFFAVILALFLGLQNSQAFWPFTKTKTKTVDEQRHSFDQNNLMVKSAVQGERTPAPSVTITGSNNTANVNYPTNSTYGAQTQIGAASQADLQTSDFESYLSKTSLPWCIALILFAIGIYLFFMALRFARAQSPAVNAAISFADSRIAEAIGNLEHQAASETDATKLSHVNAMRSVLEKARGKVNAYKPSKK